MKYEVLYMVGGEEQSDVVEAPDAAEAASTVQYEHGRTSESFELLSVNLIDELENVPLEQSGLDAATVE